MTQFTEEVLITVQNIPSGKVMSYGQVARLAGNARGARQVVRILHSMSQKYNLPWYRVINAQGRICIANEIHGAIQRELLQSEGVVVSVDGSIDLDKYRVER